MSELSGSRALVTGASRGIGRAIALELARAGAAVAFTYRSEAAQAEQTAKGIEALGGRALGLACDVADSAAVDELVERVARELGGLDVVVNNAGITRDQLILRMKPEDFDAVIATNLRGTWNLCRAVARTLLRQRRGRITVNAVAPGFIETEMTAGLPEAHKQALLAQIPLGRLGTVEDVAQAVRFLASGAAAYVTGQVIHVNGGLDM